MAEVTLSTVPNGAACPATRRLHGGAPLRGRTLRGHPQALAEMQAKADPSRFAITVTDAEVRSGAQRPRMLAAWQAVVP